MGNVREEVVRETEALSEELLKQVLVFIRFLRHGNQPLEEMPQKESMKHLEEEFEGYQKRFPRE